MRPPAIIVRLELERAPVVYVEATTEGDHRRLLDWIAAHPEIDDAVRELLELAKAWA